VKTRLVASIASVAAIIILLGFYHQSSEISPDQGHVFRSITGERFHLSDFRGKPLLLTFWATDCPSCVDEIPHLMDLYKKHHANGLRIIAIAMYYDPPSHVVALTESMRLPYPVVLDLTGNHAKSFGDVALTPTTFLLDGEGRVRFQVTGPFDKNDLSKRIDALL